MLAMGGLAVLSMRQRLERPPWLDLAFRLGDCTHHANETKLTLKMQCSQTVKSLSNLAFRQETYILPFSK
jgi:hypothetical protein